MTPDPGFRMAPPARMVRALKRYSQLRADAAREVAHGFVGVFKPELYWRFIFLTVAIHHDGQRVEFPFPEVFLLDVPIFGSQRAADLIIAHLHDTFRTH